MLLEKFGNLIRQHLRRAALHLRQLLSPPPRPSEPTAASDLQIPASRASYVLRRTEKRGERRKTQQSRCEKLAARPRRRARISQPDLSRGRLGRGFPSRHDERSSSAGGARDAARCWQEEGIQSESAVSPGAAVQSESVPQSLQSAILSAAAIHPAVS